LGNGDDQLSGAVFSELDISQRGHPRDRGKKLSCLLMLVAILNQP